MFSSFLQNNHSIYFSWLIIALPFLSITGPALPDICISLVALYFILISIIEKKFFYYNNLFVFLFLIFCIYLFIRSISSDYPLLSIQIEGSVFYVRYLFFALGTWYIYDRNPNFLLKLSYSIFIFITIVSLDGYLQFFTGKNIFGWPSYWDGMRLSSFFKEELILGSYISKYAPLGVAFYVFSKKNSKILKSNYLLLIIFLMLIEILSYISGERASFFHMTLFTILIILLSSRFRVLRLLSFFISCLLIVLIINSNKAVKERTETTINQVSTTKLKYLPYSPGHERIYISALKMFNDNPLFGQGTNLFRLKCYEEEYYINDKPECHSQPHNMYIQLLAENGLIGFSFLFLWFLFLSIKLLMHFISLIFVTKQNWRMDDGILFIYIFSFVVWWPILPHQSFFNNWTNVMLFLPVGLILKNLYEKNRNNKSN